MFLTEAADDPRPAVLLAWSGGKDSYMALRELRASHDWRVAGLLTTLAEEYDRISMHGVRADLLRAQAAAVGLPLLPVRVPAAPTDTVYGERMSSALERARAQGIRTVAFGDLFLRDVRAYRERMLEKVGMTAIFPIWGRPTSRLARDFITTGGRAILTCVDTTQVSGDLAGRAYDEALLDDLPDSADPCGENGEFHTFVHAGPELRHPIQVRKGEIVLRDDRFMYCDLLPVRE